MVQPIREKYPDKLKLYATKADLKIYIHSKIMIIDDVFYSIRVKLQVRRHAAAIPAGDTETVTSLEDVTVGKIPRDFRIRKFHEMTGLSYEKLDAMTFLDQLSIAAANESSIMDNLEVKCHTYFIATTDAIRKVDSSSQK